MNSAVRQHFCLRDSTRYTSLTTLMLDLRKKTIKGLRSNKTLFLFDSSLLSIENQNITVVAFVFLPQNFGR